MAEDIYANPAVFTIVVTGIFSIITLVIRHFLTRGEAKTGMIQSIAKDLREEIAALKSTETTLQKRIRELMLENQDLILENTKLKIKIEVIEAEADELNKTIKRLEKILQSCVPPAQY